MKFFYAAVFASLILLVSGANEKCGDDCEWDINNGELKISGSGDMKDYSYPKAPWVDKKDKFTTIEVKGLKSIGKSAFSGCDKVKSAKIEAKEIKDSAFEDCAALEGVELKGTEVLGKYVFQDSGLKKIDFPSSVSKIEDSTFYRAFKLEKIDVDEENEKFLSVNHVLYDHDFKKLLRFPSAHADKDYEIPENVTAVDTYAFNGCSQLKSLTISENVNTIGAYALIGCVNLASFIVDPSNKEFLTDNVALVDKVVGQLIKYPAKHDGKSYTIPDRVDWISPFAFEGSSNLKEILLTDEIRTIDSSAFTGCSSLESINISNRVVTFREGIFDGCTSLTEINIAPGGKSDCWTEDGCFFCKGYKGDKTLVKYPSKKEGDEYTVPDGVAKISALAFEQCKKLESVTIPASVDNIMTRGFSGLSSLSFLEYKGLKTPGYSEVFEDCPKLDEVCIPDGYKSDHFCGIKKLVKCGNYDSDASVFSSKAASSSFIVIPSFVTLAAVLAFFVHFF